MEFISLFSVFSEHGFQLIFIRPLCYHMKVNDRENKESVYTAKEGFTQTVP